MHFLIACAVLIGALTNHISVNATPEVEDADVKPWPYQTFKSSNVTAPVFRIHRSGKKTAPGLLFLSPAVPTPSSLIMDDRGELIWSGPVESSANLLVQKLYGKPVLTRWVGSVASPGTYSYGAIKILDSTYSEITTVCPKLGLVTILDTPPDCEADIHDHVITDKGTIVLPAYNITTSDLSPIGGPKDGWIIDGQFYELDIETGKTLFRWSSIDHVPVTKTLHERSGKGTSKNNAFDFFHINSIQPLSGGRYLVSARHTSTVYLIGSTGEIEWKLTGFDGGDFGPLPPEGNFSFQHDARMQDESADSMVVHIFNNNLDDVSTPKPSNGLEFRLNTSAMSVELLRRVHDPSHNYSSISQGSYMTLPNGNTLMGYGSVPIAQEFGPSGDTDLRLSIRFGNFTNLGNYRTYRQQWYGVPATKPSVVVASESSKGWISWNGATSVTHYELYTGTSRRKLVKSGKFKKRGFETSFGFPQHNSGKRLYIQLAAFEGKRLLRKTRVVHVK